MITALVLVVTNERKHLTKDITRRRKSPDVSKDWEVDRGVLERNSSGNFPHGPKLKDAKDRKAPQSFSHTFLESFHDLQIFRGEA